MSHPVPASAPPSPHPLLAELAAFRIDDTARPSWSFAQRLAHENRWKPSYAERVIVEYKRFLALTELAGHVICPSEQIDQAWHLHLLYTRSYWDRLCDGVLGRPLHHSPSSGGDAEHAKHLDLYQRTLASYRRLFGAEPPADIWPSAARRFGKDLLAARVSTADHLIVSRVWLAKLATALSAIAAAGLLGWLTS